MVENLYKGFENQRCYPDIESAFEGVVGFPFPETPGDLPNFILLPHLAVGELIEGVLALELDDPHLGNGFARERSQFVGILMRNGKLVNSRVIVGYPGRTGDALHELFSWFRPVVGGEAKPLTYWHTHTEEYGSHLSTSDAAKRVGEDRKAVIYALGAPDGITVVFQTKSAIPRRIPISTFMNEIRAYDELVRFYDSSAHYPDLSGLARYLESNGYVLYAWKKREGDTVRKGVERGDFDNGIPLTRIGDPLWLRTAREVFK